MSRYFSHVTSKNANKESEQWASRQSVYTDYGVMYTWKMADNLQLYYK